MLTSKNDDRIIDVNLNRLSEGLRVVEDIIRFKFEDKESLNTIRNLKRKLWQNLGETRKKVIWSRKSEQDIGRAAQFDRTNRTNIPDVLTANLKRSQESARVLEELFKITKPEATNLFKKIRFTLYDLEKEILMRISLEFEPRIYVLIDIASVGRKHLSEITKSCILGGATMIQLREPKDIPTNQWIKDARKIKDSIKNSKVKFIINDRIDVCQAVDADGIHLGNTDMPIPYARKILGDGKIIGKTTRNLKQALTAEKQGADYISVGAIFPSPTKTTAPVVGTEQLITVIKGVKKPVVAIGGITPQKAKQLFRLGVSGIAITSSVFTEVDFSKKEFGKKIIENLKKFR